MDIEKNNSVLSWIQSAVVRAIVGISINMERMDETTHKGRVCSILIQFLALMYEARLLNVFMEGGSMKSMI